MARNGNGKENTRIASAVTKTAFMHLELAEQIGKLRIFTGTYRSGEGMQASIVHYMDLDAAYVLFHDILTRSMEEPYREYKGSKRDGEIVSRVMSVNRRNGNVYFEFASGPGRETQTGAIMPVKGAGATKVLVVLPEFEARKLAARTLPHLSRVLAHTFIDAPDRSRAAETHEDPFGEDSPF